MNVEEIGLLDHIETVLVEAELNYFARNLKERNHFYTIYAFDLVSVLSYRPSMSIWKSVIKDDFTEEAESWLFQELLGYILNNRVEVKFTTMISSLANAIKNTLRTEYKFEVNEITRDMLVEITRYITSLAGAINKVTNNILDNSKDMTNVMLGDDNASCSYGKYGTANEYFENESEPLHYIHTITTKFHNGRFRGLLIVWSLRKNL